MSNPFDESTAHTPTPDDVDLSKFKPRENAPDANHHSVAGVARVAVDDPLMNFEVGGRRYSTREGGTTMPRADAEALIASGVPGVKLMPVSSQGFGPGAKVGGRPRHEFYPGDCACDTCKGISNDHS